MNNTIHMEGIEITIEDNSEEIMQAFKNAIDRGLKVIGEKVVDYAQKLCPVKTGNLAGSITYKVMDESSVEIGTAVEYGKYVELGTGLKAEEGGRQTPWTYQGKDGKWYRTTGQKPVHFLRDAMKDHLEEYRNILIESLENA